MQQYPFLVNQDNSGLAGPVHAVAELEPSQFCSVIQCTGRGIDTIFKH